MNIYIYIYIGIDIYIFIGIYVYIFVYIYSIYISVCIYTHMYICIINTHTRTYIHMQVRHCWRAGTQKRHTLLLRHPPTTLPPRHTPTLLLLLLRSSSSKGKKVKNKSASRCVSRCELVGWSTDSNTCTCVLLYQCVWICIYVFDADIRVFPSMSSLVRVRAKHIHLRCFRSVSECELAGLCVDSVLYTCLLLYRGV